MLTIDTSPPAHVPCCKDFRTAVAVARLRYSGRHRARTVPYRRPDELKPARWDNAHKNGHLDFPGLSTSSVWPAPNYARTITSKRSEWALAKAAAQCYEGGVGGVDAVRFAGTILAHLRATSGDIERQTATLRN